MKTTQLLAGILIAVLNALVLVPELSQYGAYFLAGSIALALWLALKAMLQRAPTAGEPSEPAPSVEKAAPVPPPVAKRAAEAEALAVVGMLQAKGRLIDFVMDDISKYSDAQVGSAARVVHQGCRSAFDELFTIEPISTEKEGTRVTVAAESVNDYRLIGAVSGEPPYSGILAHKGWRTSKVNLPRVIKLDDDRLPPIAPAQVELK